MATTLYPRTSVSTFTLGNFSVGSPFSPNLAKRELLLTRGGSVASQIDSSGSDTEWGQVGADPGLNNSACTALVYITNGLSAVTISGSITCNMRGAESNAMANAGLQMYSLLKLDGTTGDAVSTVSGAQSNGTELGTTEADRSVTFTPTSTALANGDRLMLVMAWTHVGTAASGYTLTAWYNGPTAGASGDTYITFTETITEYAGGGGGGDVPESYIGGGYYPMVRRYIRELEDWLRGPKGWKPLPSGLMVPT